VDPWTTAPCIVYFFVLEARAGATGALTSSRVMISIGGGALGSVDGAWAETGSALHKASKTPTDTTSPLGEIQPLTLSETAGNVDRPPVRCDERHDRQRRTAGALGAAKHASMV
jgi:hypothetical protein